jgi:hypothetical protein
MSTIQTILGLSCALMGCGTSANLNLGGGATPIKADTGGDITYLPEDTGEDGDPDGGDTGSSADDTGEEIIVDTGDEPEPAIEGTGYGRGDTAYDLLSSDHTGAPFSLHALAGSPVVLLIGDLYDARATDTLTAMASLVGEHSDTYFVALIGQDASTSHCDADCAAGVAADYGIPIVLYDASPALPVYTTWAQGNAPRLYIMNSEMEISWVNFGSTPASQLDDKLDDLD